MTESLAGQRALVTGASGGLGGAIIRRLAAEGMTVVASGRRQAALDSIAAETGATVLVGDLADRAGVGRSWRWPHRLTCWYPTQLFPPPVRSTTSLLTR
jgi:NADP-dependent 3-hydroxy acid dehydrogenase YdfG